MKNKRDQLYLNTLLGSFECFAQMAGIEDFSRTQIGKKVVEDSLLTGFISRGNKFAGESSYFTHSKGDNGALLSIFDFIKTSTSTTGSSVKHTFPIKSLNPNGEDCFAIPYSSQSKYSQAWDALEEEFSKLVNYE